MPSSDLMFCQATPTRTEEFNSFSPGGGMILPSSNQEEIVKGFLSELTFWGDLPATAEMEKRDDLLGEQLFRHSDSSVEPRQVQRSTETPKSPINMGPVWRTAVDPHTGRTYYYDAISRRTQWDKPDEIRNLERQRRQEKRAKDRLFFLEMEQNIIASLAAGELIPGINHDSSDNVDSPSNDAHDTECFDNADKPARIRTISGMDQVMVETLKERIPKSASATATASTAPRTIRDAHGRPPLPSGRARPVGITSQESSASLELSPDPAGPQKPPVRQLNVDESTDSLHGEALLDSLMDDVPLGQELKLQDTQNSLARPQSLQNHMRRNTGGTMFVKSTMMNPNIEATIKCVCGVYRTHIVDFAAQRANRSPISIMGYTEPKYEISETYKDLPSGDLNVPTQEEVVLFYKDFYQRSQMEHDTIIMSLIYVERLIKATAGAIAPLPENWRSILFSCMVLASKVWDDLSMWNVDFSNVCVRDRTQLSAFTLSRINTLELALLKSLNFNVKVPASEYAKYYFLIRGMLMKSGLLNEQHGLDVKGAMNLEKIRLNNQEMAKVVDSPAIGHRMTKSLDNYEWINPIEDENGPLHSTVF